MRGVPGMLPIPQILRTLVFFTLALPTLCLSAGGLTIAGGINRSSIEYGGQGASPTFDDRRGYNVGIGYEGALTSSLYLFPEINLETRGAKSDLESLELQYVQIPIFLLYKAPSDLVVVDFFAGPAIGIPFKGEVNTESETTDILRDLRFLEWGVEAGGGLEFEHRRFALFARPSYYWGLTRLFAPGRPEYRNRNLKLRTGVRLFL